MIELPGEVRRILQRLEEQGHEAYAVGGCVRDSLLGLIPRDWDVCTSALPKEVKACFAGEKLIETGIAHGTVTLMLCGEAYEITTYRREEGYEDHRRPERVNFVSSLEEDLARRDFTVNAMAYHPVRGLKDPFGGQGDLERGLLRCVGDARVRFEEDALRILRALRFAAVYGFAVEAQTENALREKKPLLLKISMERIREELLGLLLGKGAEEVLLRFSDVLSTILPEIAPMTGFAQNTPYHHLDVWAHTAKAVACAPKDRLTRLAALLHDVGKPACYTVDERGRGHFYGHGKISAGLARDILLRLRFDRNTRERTEALVLYHDAPIAVETPKVKRWLGRLGTQDFFRLLDLKRADALAKNPAYQQESLVKIEELRRLGEEIIKEGQCFSVRDLAVSGNDLKNAGIPEGKEMGEILQKLLSLVMDGSLPNEGELLVDRALSLWRLGE